MATCATSPIRSPYKFIEIAANLTDPKFRGICRGKTVHPDDFDAVVERAVDIGVEKIIITGGNLEDSKEALKLARTNERFYCTVGCHPTRCNDFEKADGGAEQYLEDLHALIREGGDKVVSLGELGLDYDRLHFCPKETQLKYFEMQFKLAELTKLPLFLHSRNCHQDFIDLMRKHKGRYSGGVVHSFTGQAAEIPDLIDLDLFVGINGCSLKHPDSLSAMTTIPRHKLMIETDAPWCGIRRTHPGHRHVKTDFPTVKMEKFQPGHCVKDRSEPCHIVQVLEVMAGERGEDATDLAEVIYRNTADLFFSPR